MGMDITLGTAIGRKLLQSVEPSIDAWMLLPILVRLMLAMPLMLVVLLVLLMCAVFLLRLMRLMRLMR